MSSNLSRCRPDRRRDRRGGLKKEGEISYRRVQTMEQGLRESTISGPSPQRARRLYQPVGLNSRWPSQGGRGGKRGWIHTWSPRQGAQACSPGRQPGGPTPNPSSPGRGRQSRHQESRADQAATFVAGEPSSDGFKVGPHHVRYSADRGVLPEIIEAGQPLLDASP
jgi:hypothetical protein